MTKQKKERWCVKGELKKKHLTIRKNKSLNVYYTATKSGFSMQEAGVLLELELNGYRNYR